MQNPPVPDPSNPSASSGYEAYPSAASAGAPAPSYAQGYAQQAPAYSAQSQSYTPPTYDPQSQGQGYTPPAFGSSAPQSPAYNQAQAQGAGFFKALFDFSFSSYITVSFAKIVYIALIVVCGLSWLSMILMGFAFDSQMGTFFGPLALFLGWIPSVVNIVLSRLGLEAAVALIRIAQNTTELVSQGKKG